MSRPIYLAIFSNGSRRAHYAVYIPDGATSTSGKLIHVTGNRATGFYLQFKRNDDLDSRPGKRQIIELAQVNAQYIKDTVGNTLQEDTTARDRLESVATIVPPPGPSPNPFDPSARSCQNWLLDYVQKLVEEGLVPSSAISVVENAPKVI